MTPIDWKQNDEVKNSENKSVGRQSLVTPIDWKRQKQELDRCSVNRRQSLVTPIDWKHQPRPPASSNFAACRQSLVTPIDWKPIELDGGVEHGIAVANPW